MFSTRAADGPGAPRAPRRRPVSPVTVGVVVAVLALTAVLATLARTISTHTEKRLLQLKVAETGSVLTALVPGVETPLRSAAEITNASGGDKASFTQYLGAFVGDGKPFVAASLWRISPGPPTLVTSLGSPLVLQQHPDMVDGVFSRARSASGVSVSRFLTDPDPRLGYALTTAVPSTRLAVYAESALPPGARVPRPRSGPFSDLLFELYLGRRADPSMLLYGNVARLSDRTDSVTVPFGDTDLTLVGAAAHPLAGRLTDSMWWIALVTGLVLAAGVGLATERLLRRRAQAQSLADRLEQTLAEQRRISSDLQHALLPRQLPDIVGVASAARYLVGTEGVEIGGDWYDVVELDDGRAFFTVGDVSGRGLDAGTVMARLQYAARALAQVDPSPATVLAGLSRLLDITVDGRFATVLCGLLDVEHGSLVLASAGHLPPLVVDTTGAGSPRATVAQVSPGPPIGVAATGDYAQLQCPLPDAGALLAFTDGLVERRDETIYVGIQRAADAAGVPFDSLDELLERLIAARGDDVDDTAVIGLGWTAIREGAPEGVAAPASLAAPTAS